MQHTDCYIKNVYDRQLIISCKGAQLGEPESDLDAVLTGENPEIRKQSHDPFIVLQETSPKRSQSLLSSYTCMADAEDNSGA